MPCGVLVELYLEVAAGLHSHSVAVAHHGLGALLLLQLLLLLSINCCQVLRYKDKGPSCKAVLHCAAEGHPIKPPYIAL